MSEELQFPAPYSGGKSRVVDVGWRAMGPDVPAYCEPFCGSAAMLFGRPSPGKYETINDSSGFVVNVLRSIQKHPHHTAEWCAGPPSELELRAKRQMLIRSARTLCEELEANANWCNPKLAGAWIYCQSLSVGLNWTAKRPAACKGSRKGVFGLRADDVDERFALLSKRLRRVLITCSDWSTLLTPSALGFNTTGTTPVGVFFDPPYPDEEHDYGAAPDTAAKCVEWCRANGDDARLRIVLAGHVGDYALPGWRTLNWGGSRGWGREKRGNNECLWFSPHCLPFDQQPSLFGEQHA